MLKFNGFKKILSFVSASIMAVSLVSVYPKQTSKSGTASAKTIAEIQEEKKANDAKIAEYEQQISELEGSKDNEKQYQTVLKEQITVIQDNIALLNTQLEKISADIENSQNNIEQLDITIENQQQEIDNKIEDFKQRLCAMYVSGNDNLASVVVGSSSFYDMLSRVEMVNRIASHDEQLIDEILTDIDELEQSKKSLESEKLLLEMQLEEQEKRKEEKAEEMESLNVKMQETQEEIDRLAREQEVAESNKAELEAANKELEAEEARIQEEIRRAAEEAQRKYEEEQRRLAEEAARQQAAQQAAQQQQQQAAQGDSEGSYTPSVPEVDTTPVYTPPAPSATGFMWPAPGFAYISSGVGPRWGRSHNGIDIAGAGIMGASIVASKAGTVVTVSNSCSHNYAKTSSCGCGGGYGNYVVIAHDGTYSTLYGHLTSAAVSVGQYVSQGQVIGYAGSTGWSTGAHLHFEVRVNGATADPEYYVSP